MKKLNKFSPEVFEWAVRMVQEQRRGPPVLCGTSLEYATCQP